MICLTEEKLTRKILFERLNNYHPKINLNLKSNPKKFLDTKLICVDGILVFIKLWSKETQPNYQSLGHQKYLKVINKMPLLGIYIDQREFR